jgi:TolB-like protein/Flp pilus assembly protein TadD
MPSLIPGYNYDIFISYRQKDNKGDMWVSEFVEALKTELESTFKEEISVYFDINPHDGLLETHDVDESLKDKLKCLVFIPIISRTYCDPKSFAWEHEFKAFVDLASKDQYGLKVKLPNGNVANRVLPVQIHDLDNEDIALCGSVIGGVLRGIEFIYKEPGVNKPLTVDDDEKKNLNGTKYRIQINKVANAIKDITTAIQQYNPQQDEIKQTVSKPITTPQKSKKSPIIRTSVVALTLIILGILFIPKLFKPSEKLEKSIAVLPFINDSSDPENIYFINGLTDELLNNLQKIKSFSKVLSRTSVEQYRDSDRPTIPEIAKNLNVNYIVEGSGQKYGNSYRLRVQLIEARSDRHLWAESYEKEIRETRDIYNTQILIAQAIAEKLKATITPEEKLYLRKTPTENLEAYNLYLKGTYFYQKMTKDDLEKALDYFEKALQIDPQYSLAYIGLSEYNSNSTFWGNVPPMEGIPKAIGYIQKALEIDSTLAEAYWQLGNINTFYFWNWKEAEKNYRYAIQINPNSSNIHMDFSNLLAITGRTEEAISEAERAQQLDPQSALITARTGAILAFSGQFDRAIEEYNMSLSLDADNFYAHLELGNAYVAKVMYEEAITEYEKAAFLSNGNPFITAVLISNYYTSGRTEQAEQLFNGLKTRSGTEYVPPSCFYLIYRFIDKEDLALAWLKKAFDEHDTFLPMIKDNPFIFPEGTQYKAVLKEKGLL